MVHIELFLCVCLLCLIGTACSIGSGSCCSHAAVLSCVLVLCSMYWVCVAVMLNNTCRCWQLLVACYCLLEASGLLLLVPGGIWILAVISSRLLDSCCFLESDRCLLPFPDGLGGRVCTARAQRAQRGHNAHMTGRNWGFFATIGNILAYTNHTTPPQRWTA